MNDNGQMIEKEIFIEEQTDETGVPLGLGIGFVNWLAGAGPTIPGWWSTSRDNRLRTFYKDSDHLSGTVFTFRSMMTATPFKILPRDNTVKSHAAQAKIYDTIIKNNTHSRSNVSTQSWESGYGPFIEDVLTQDNGGFFAIEGPGRPDGPLTGTPTALIHLDSFRCQRTGSREYPVLYTDLDGRRFKLHNSRVIVYSSMSSSIAELYGIGFCAVSRCIHTAQSLIDDLNYKEEKMGSRPKRGLMVVEGASQKAVKTIESAMMMADEGMDNRGLARYAPIPLIGLRTGQSLSLFDLASVPDGFDYLQDVQLGMSLMALAFGVDVRQLAFAIGVAGQTKADAEIQHIKMEGKGPGEIFQVTKQQLEQKFLPPYLKIEFDRQDDFKDQLAAQIKNERSERHERDVNTGTVSIRVAREQMVEDGDLTGEQFVQLELEDGRLEDGSEVTSLIYSNDKVIRELMDVGEGTDEEVQAAIEQAQEMIMTAPNANVKNKARSALAALRKLRPMNEEMAEETIEEAAEEEAEIVD
jgi:hypothetical protein